MIPCVSEFLLVTSQNTSLRKTLKNLCEIFTSQARIQDSQSPTVAPKYLNNKSKASSELQLFNTIMNKLTVNYTLRDWLFAISLADMNPVYDITFLVLYFSLRMFHTSWSMEPYTAQRASGNCQQQTLRRRSTTWF